MAEEHVSEKVEVRGKGKKPAEDPNLKGGARGGQVEKREEPNPEPPIVQRTP